jgi:hypothetical protein
MERGLHMASRAFQLAVTAVPVVLPGRPLGACTPEGGGPAEVGDTGFPWQGVFPVSLHTCLALEPHSVLPRPLSSCVHIVSALFAICLPLCLFPLAHVNHKPALHCPNPALAALQVSPSRPL